MLVAEFTLTENQANTTNSLLRQLCHAEDSIVLGTWLQETDHRTIEDQVRFRSFPRYLIEIKSTVRRPTPIRAPKMCDVNR